VSDASLLTNCTCGTCDGCQAAMNDFLCETLCIAQEQCKEIGTILQFVLRIEDDVDRDDYESIKAYQDATTRTFSICAMDVLYQPNQHRLERAGLYEEAEVAIKTPTKCWLDAGVDFRDIDIKRTTVEINGETYKIREKNREQVIVGTVPMFYVFGLVKN
jgi:hypothetical protein